MVKIFQSKPVRRSGAKKTPGQKAKQTRLSYKGKGGSVKTGTRYR